MSVSINYKNTYHLSLKDSEADFYRIDKCLYEYYSKGYDIVVSLNNIHINDFTYLQKLYQTAKQHEKNIIFKINCGHPQLVDILRLEYNFYVEITDEFISAVQTKTNYIQSIFSISKIRLAKELWEDILNCIWLNNNITVFFKDTIDREAILNYPDTEYLECNSTVNLEVTDGDLKQECILAVEKSNEITNNGQISINICNLNKEDKIEEKCKQIKLAAYRASMEQAKLSTPFTGWDKNREANNAFLHRIFIDDPDLYFNLTTFGRKNISLLTSEGLNNEKEVLTDVEWKHYLRLQSSIQRHVDGGIETVIRLPEYFTCSKIEEILLHAYKLNCKKIQIRVNKNLKLQEAKQAVITKIKRPTDLECEIHRFRLDNTYHGIILVSLFEGRPYEIFSAIEDGRLDSYAKDLTAGETGLIHKTRKNKYNIKYGEFKEYEDIERCMTAEQLAITRLVSVSLQYDIPLDILIQRLKLIDSSYTAGIVKVLSRYVK